MWFNELARRALQLHILHQPHSWLTNLTPALPWRQRLKRVGQPSCWQNLHCTTDGSHSFHGPALLLNQTNIQPTSELRNCVRVNSGRLYSTASLGYHVATTWSPIESNFQCTEPSSPCHILLMLNFRFYSVRDRTYYLSYRSWTLHHIHNSNTWLLKTHICMCVCVYIYIYIHICIYICMCVYIYIYIYIHTHKFSNWPPPQFDHPLCRSLYLGPKQSPKQYHGNDSLPKPTTSRKSVPWSVDLERFYCKWDIFFSYFFLKHIT